jgi:hypothetical protein
MLITGFDKKDQKTNLQTLRNQIKSKNYWTIKSSFDLQSFIYLI